MTRTKEIIYDLPLSLFEQSCTWEETTLGEIVTILGGGTPDTETPDFWNPREIPWATPTDISATEGNEIGDTERWISQAGLIHSTLIPENSVLMTSRATIGEAKINRVPMAINQGFAALIPKDGYSVDYIYYLINLLRPVLVRLGAGTTFLELSRREIKKIKIRIPKEEEQRRLARVLNIADNAISKAKDELHHAKNLQAALLKDLFEAGIGTPMGLHKSKWMTCPAHWVIKPLKKFANVKSGFTMGRDLSRVEKVSIPYVTVVNVQDGYFNLTNIASIEIKRDELETDVLMYGDILMTEGGDRDKLGRGGMWKDAITPCAYQNHIFRIRLDSDYLPELFHFLIQTYQAKKYFFDHAKQTSNLCTINSRELKNWSVAIPPMNEQRVMIDLLQAAEARCISMEARVRALSAVKDSLLHNLFTGRVHIPEDTVHA